MQQRGVGGSFVATSFLLAAGDVTYYKLTSICHTINACPDILVYQDEWCDDTLCSEAAKEWVGILAKILRDVIMAIIDVTILMQVSCVNMMMMKKARVCGSSFSSDWTTHSPMCRRNTTAVDRQMQKRRSVQCCMASSVSCEPDLWLDPPAGGARIAVFGTVHADTQDSRSGSFIVQEKPQSVVVETALNPSHGSETGNILDLESCLRSVPDGVRDPQTLGMAQLAARLKDTGDILSSEVWKDLLASNMIYSEHLAYVSALSVEADLVFGDRPKLTTYQRMLMCPTLADLDIAFGAQCASNYHDLASSTPFQKEFGTINLTEKILFEERDAVLLKSLQDASMKAGSGSVVVGVVGASHIPGMSKLWESQSWSNIANDAVTAPTTRPEDERPESFGVRRALFDGVIRLTCRADVTYDAAMTLGPPPPESMDAYELTSELYGSTRMLLATLTREQLKQVCSGWRCDPWDFLEPLRNVRPCNGGPGYDEELVMHLRTLNFELS